jgi:hypothetical protein
MSSLKSSAWHQDFYELELSVETVLNWRIVKERSINTKREKRVKKLQYRS